MLFGLLNCCAGQTGQWAFVVVCSRGRSCCICAVKWLPLHLPHPSIHSWSYSSYEGAVKVLEQGWWRQNLYVVRIDLEEPVWGRTFEKSAVGEDKEKKIRHPGCEIIAQRLGWFRRLHMQDRHARNEEKNIIFSLPKATSLPVQHTETSLFQRHQFKMTAIKQDMWPSS